MAKTEMTVTLEHMIWNFTQATGTFGCFEVTIGFGGRERVDYMTYDTSGIFRCYEIKVSKSDFHSQHKHSFVGHYNYFVLTHELWQQVVEEIPDWVGCIVCGECVKKPKKQDIDNKEYKTRKTINGRSTEVTMPWTEMLKDSFIRSLARDSQKLYKSGNQNFVDRTNRKVAECQRTTQYYKDRFNILYSNVKALLGRNVLRLLDGELLNYNEIQENMTNHQRILMMNKEQMAKKFVKYLAIFGINQSASKIEKWLGEKPMIEFRHVKEHVEVYKDGEFVVSADNESEARQFLREMEDDYGTK